jgi:mRNA interferase HigB
VLKSKGTINHQAGWSTLKAFVNRSPAYAEARQLVMAWYRQVRSGDWATPADVKRAIGTASILNDGRAVFNIAGNKYRIVLWINHPYQRDYRNVLKVRQG